MNDSPSLPRALQLAKSLIEQRLGPGDRAIDATTGNGHDTTFLAELVGESGKVFGFDIQKSAIESTKERTKDIPQVELHLAGHESIFEHIDTAPKAAMFNLGFLPGSQKDVITRPDTTICALQQIAERLLPGGIITLVLYTGHEGGREEADAVAQWCSNLDQSRFSVINYRFLNQKNSPPSLIAIERK